VRMKTTRKEAELVFDEKTNTWKQTGEEVSNRRAGYDFCFSVPKSVSLYLVETGDKIVERKIHESFKETMLDIESRMQARVRGAGENGEQRNGERATGNLVYASFVHTETRPIDGIPDPHYHIHAFTFNATFDPEEERWKAGEFGNIKRDALSTRQDFMPASPASYWKAAMQSEELTGTLSLRACLENLSKSSQSVHNSSKNWHERNIS
jgi:hypothetical protein